MTILYFTNTLGAYSETFIHRIIELFRKDKEIDIHIVTSKKSSSVAKDVVYSGWNKFSLHERVQLKISEKLNRRRQAIEKVMAKKIKEIKVPFDVAWVDFGVNAILIYSHLNKLGKRVICHVHGYDASKSLQNRLYSSELVRFSQENYIITPSNHLKRRLELVGCYSSNIFVIPYSISPDIKPKVWHTNPQNSLHRLLFVGRFVDKKCPQALIHMLRLVVNELPKAHLVMCGDGLLMPIVQQLILEKQLEKNVTLMGAVSQNQVYEEMKKADIYIQHSVTANSGDQEGFPNSLAEAAAHALPIISTTHSGITEIVQHEETGFLVQEHDYVSMAQYTIQLLKNPALIVKMGENSRQRILQLSNEKIRLFRIKEVIELAVKNKMAT